MSQTKQILIAEDDNFMRTLLEAQCRNLGMQTHAVPDGAEAVTEALPMVPFPPTHTQHNIA